jgi:hypothetical protein
MTQRQLSFALVLFLFFLKIKFRPVLLKMGWLSHIYEAEYIFPDDAQAVLYPPASLTCR